MRIITGTARGAKLRAPKGLDTRPTSDRIKGAIFSIVSDKVIGRRVLDLYAGTGSLGLEALSRGASSAVLVDKATAAILKANAEHTHLSEQAAIRSGDVQAELARLTRMVRPDSRFSLVFADPPYHGGLAERTLQSLDEAAGELLAPEAIVVIEHGGDVELPATRNLSCVLTRRYGHTTQLSFYQRADYLAEQ